MKPQNPQVRKYGARTFAAYDLAGNLLAVTVYKKGALNIIATIAEYTTSLHALQAELISLRAEGGK